MRTKRSSNSSAASSTSRAVAGIARIHGPRVSILQRRSVVVVASPTIDGGDRPSRTQPYGRCRARKSPERFAGSSQFLHERLPDSQVSDRGSDRGQTEEATWVVAFVG